MMIVKKVVSHSWARIYFVNIHDAEEKKYLGSFPHFDESFVDKIFVYLLK